MVYVICAVAMALCSAMIKPMELETIQEGHGYKDFACDVREVESYDPIMNRKSRGKEVKQKEPIQHHSTQATYFMDGINSISINGQYKGVESGRVSVVFEQVSGSAREEIIIVGGKHDSIFVNSDAKSGLCSLDQINNFGDDITIHVALKKYTKILTSNNVDTTFSSPLEADILHLNVSGGATMQLPDIKANKVALVVHGDDSLVKGQDKALCKAADLLFMYRQDRANIELAIETELLQMQSRRGKGNITLQGVANKQELLIRKGSFFGFGLESKKIRISHGVGDDKSYIQLNATELIDGFMMNTNQYNVEWRVPHSYVIQMSCITKPEWKKRFSSKVVKTIDLKDGDPLLLK